MKSTGNGVQWASLLLALASHLAFGGDSSTPESHCDPRDFHPSDLPAEMLGAVNAANHGCYQPAANLSVRCPGLPVDAGAAKPDYRFQAVFSNRDVVGNNAASPSVNQVNLIGDAKVTDGVRIHINLQADKLFSYTERGGVRDSKDYQDFFKEAKVLVNLDDHTVVVLGQQVIPVGLYRNYDFSTVKSPMKSLAEIDGAHAVQIRYDPSAGPLAGWVDRIDLSAGFAENQDTKSRGGPFVDLNGGKVAGPWTFYFGAAALDHAPESSTMKMPKIKGKAVPNSDVEVRVSAGFRLDLGPHTAVYGTVMGLNGNYSLPNTRDLETLGVSTALPGGPIYFPGGWSFRIPSANVYVEGTHVDRYKNRATVGLRQRVANNLDVAWQLSQDFCIRVHGQSCKGGTQGTVNFILTVGTEGNYGGSSTAVRAPSYVDPSSPYGKLQTEIDKD